jgi:uncharacterized protein involved in exopolysaccharide biosynthesis
MRAEVERIARAVWPLAAGVLLGLAIGGVWTVLQSDRYAAETHLILNGPPADRLAPAVVTLANGSVVQENIRQTLRLSSPPNLSASIARSVLEIVAEADNKERARQVDAEAAQVITQLVATRFGSQGLQASLLDPAHVVDQTSPTPGRNLLICGLLGLLGGGALAYWRSRQKSSAPPIPGGAVDPTVERRLKQRVDEVTKRERALARRAGELAKREAGLEQRRGELDQREARLKQRDVELGATKQRLAARAGDLAASERDLQARAAEPPPPPPAAAEPAPGPVRAPPATHAGSWNIGDLERTVDSQSDATPEQVEEWGTYLFFLREHASADGSLPRQFDGLVEEVFGKLSR